VSTDDELLDTEASGTSGSRLGAPRRRLLLVAAVAIPALVVILVWFAPQALLFDDVVDEGFPVGGPAVQEDVAPDPAAGDDAEPAEVEPAASGPVELATGSFVSRNRYTVTGTATTYRLQDGQRLLRLEDFESTNGPDLFVYLTAAGAGDDDDVLDVDFVDLGVLSGNIGNQNYVIPAGVDLDRYTTVVIWCRRFTSSFGVADLMP
jgi:hypothetical protein